MGLNFGMAGEWRRDRSEGTTGHEGVLYTIHIEFEMLVII
jgi:hypothetical protein